MRNKTMPRLLPAILVLSFAIGSAAAGADSGSPWVFSQGFGNGSKSLEPRGGSTRGAPVEPDPDTTAFDRIREDGLDSKARDRRAIHALAGEFRTRFEFVETAALMDGYQRDARPYRSWATEWVFVLTDRPDLIRLQHILVMVIEQDDGSLSDPIVTKHWRQDWHWQPDTVWRYRGDRTWAKEPVPDSKAQGAWKQSVYQVDDSPRYEAIGRWHHADGISEWRSERFLRPLPRRERSVRDDYQAIGGTHDITVTPDGWLHGQQNRKLRRQDDGEWRAIAREVGLNRYQRITGRDFDPGRSYWDRQAPFWAAVRAEWRELQSSNQRLRVRHEHDGTALFSRLFAAADEIESDLSEQALRERVSELIAPFVTPLADEAQ